MMGFTPKKRIAAALAMAGLLLCGIWFFPAFFKRNFLLLVSAMIAVVAATPLKGKSRFVVGISLFFFFYMFIALAPNPLGIMKKSIACDWFDRCEPWQLREQMKMPAVPLPLQENDSSR